MESASGSLTVVADWPGLSGVWSAGLVSRTLSGQIRHHNLCAPPVSSGGGPEAPDVGSAGSRLGARSVWSRLVRGHWRALPHVGRPAPLVRELPHATLHLDLAHGVDEVRDHHRHV